MQFWPFLVAKQCYHCQGLGHVQADCPTLRISGAGTGGRCYSCGQPGHLAVSISYNPLRLSVDRLKRACPNNGFHAVQPMGIGRGAFIARGGFGGGFRGGFAGGPRPATCYKCGGPNHYARDCQAQAMKCYACGKLVSSMPGLRGWWQRTYASRAIFHVIVPLPTEAPWTR